MTTDTFFTSGCQYIVSRDQFESVKSGERLNNPPFFMYCGCSGVLFKFRLDIYPKGRGESAENRQKVSVYLQSLPPSPKVVLTFVLSIKGHPQFCSVHKRTFDSSAVDVKNTGSDVNAKNTDFVSNCWGFPRYCPQDFASISLADGENAVFSVTVTIWSKDLVKVTSNVVSKPDMISAFPEVYQLVVEEKSDDFCGEFVLVGSDKAKVRCSKAILAASSEVFKIMCTTDMKEKKEGVVDIGDMTGAEIKLMLKFIHTGCLQANCTDAEVLQMVGAADKYSMEVLKEACEKRMVTTLKNDNAVAFLLCAVTFNLKSMKVAASKFIADNWPEMKKRPDRKDLFSNEDAAVAIMDLVTGK